MNGNVAIFIFCCRITNCHQLTGLEQEHRCLLSEVRVDGALLPAQGLVRQKSRCGLARPSSGNCGEDQADICSGGPNSAPCVGLRSSDPCWLSANGHPRLLKAAHTPFHMAPPHSHAINLSYFCHQPEKSLLLKGSCD